MSQGSTPWKDTNKKRELDADFHLNQHVFRTIAYTATGFGLGIGASLFFKHKAAMTAFFSGSGFGYGISGLNNELKNFRSYRSFAPGQGQGSGSGSGAGSQLGHAAEDLASRAKDAAQRGGQQVTQGAKDLAQNAQGHAQDAKNAVQKGGQQVAQGAKDLAQNVKDHAQDAKNAAQKGGNQAAQGAKDLAHDAKDAANKAVNKIAQNLPGSGSGDKHFQHASQPQHGSHKSHTSHAPQPTHNPHGSASQHDTHSQIGSEKGNPHYGAQQGTQQGIFHPTSQGDQSATNKWNFAGTQNLQGSSSRQHAEHSHELISDRDRQGNARYDQGESKDPDRSGWKSSLSPRQGSGKTSDMNRPGPPVPTQLRDDEDGKLANPNIGQSAKDVGYRPPVNKNA